MDQNELRRMPEILAIAEYLQNMKFKRKTFGGVDTDSILEHISFVTLRYEEIILGCLARNGEQAWQIGQLQGRLAQIEQENAAWDGYCRQLAQWYEGTNAWLHAQNVQLQLQVTALWGRWAYAQEMAPETQ